MSQNFKDWVVDWFADNAGVDEIDILANTHQNYFNNGWIDSFTFINLIGDIEDEFDIAFENDEFQDRDFSTIKGLVDILKKKADAQV